MLNHFPFPFFSIGKDQTKSSDAVANNGFNKVDALVKTIC